MHEYDAITTSILGAPSPHAGTITVNDGEGFVETLEIGAEVFASELLLPEQMFLDLFASRTCTPQEIVDVKRSTRTTLSYKRLAKRAEFLGWLPWPLWKMGTMPAQSRRLPRRTADGAAARLVDAIEGAIVRLLCHVAIRVAILSRSSTIL